MAVGFGGCRDILDDIDRITADFCLKVFLLGLSLGNVGKLLLPSRCQLRGGQPLGRKLQHLPSLGGQVDVLVFFLNHKAVEKLLNNIRTGGDSAKASGFPKGLFEALVGAFHIFDRVLHRSQEGGFRKGHGRLCLAFRNLTLAKAYFLTLDKIRDTAGYRFLIFFVLFEDAAACLDGFDFLPAGLLDDFSLESQTFAAADGGHFCLLVFAGRQKGGQETGYHQLIDFTLPIFQFAEADALLGGDNGVVVGHLLVVDKGFIAFDGCLEQLGADGRISAAAAGFDTLWQGIHDICGQVTGIRPRIGDYLVMLIQPLHIIQGLLGRKAKHAVGVLLEGSQVI